MLESSIVWLMCRELTLASIIPPTGGIAAANVEVEGTDVTATTLHALLELDGELKTKLDLVKLDHAKVASATAMATAICLIRSTI